MSGSALKILTTGAIFTTSGLVPAKIKTRFLVVIYLAFI